ncbi:MAG: DNA-binding protein WhiA [Clostridia bacterium]|nr:DNA-binding protein WhiA [Clostridia bacterium]
MNFGESLKNEILAKPIRERHCKKAFLAGIIRGTGEIYETDGELGFQFKVSSEETAMQVSLMLKSLFNYDVREISVSEDRLNAKDKIVISVSGQRAYDILLDLGVLVEEENDVVVSLKFYGELTEKECCLRSFIKGLYLSCGSCTIPSNQTATKTGYHLEMVFSHYTPALETSEKLAEFSVLTKVTRRKDSFIVYIKSAEEIKDFIAFLPAPLSVLKLTDTIINRDLSNNSNRQKNCDLGNVNRQIEASMKQIDAVEKIAEVIGLETLKPDLRETAKLRLDNPDDTLIELAEKLKVTKSCLNHRLRKLVSIANEL